MDYSIRVDSGEAWRASTWLGEAGSARGIPAETLSRLDLCVTEAVANAIDHGGAGTGASPICLRLDVRHSGSGGEATVTVSDAGNAFDPLTAPEKARAHTLAEAEPGGLGLTMLRRFADALDYSYSEGRNHLTIRVRWNRVEGAGVIVARTSFARGPDRRKGRRGYTPDRRCLAADRRRGDLERLTLFRGTDLATVARDIGDCDVITVPAGTPLLKPGDANDAVYVLLTGRVAAYLDNARDFASGIVIAPGECIGELSAIDGKPASALVLAQSEARVLTLPRELFWSRLMSMPAVGRNLLAALAERMRRANEAMLEAQRRRLTLEYLQQELELARQLQAGMLPLRRPLFPDRPDVEIAGMMEPASSVGGDLFDAFFVDEGRLFLCVGDVSGHGVAAALFMARAIGVMRIAAMGTTQPERLLERINEELCIGNDTSMFMTIFCGFFEVASGRLTYSNGGHCAPLLIGRGGASRLPLPRGTMAGAMPGLRYAAREIVLEDGEMLVCFTDGATEAQNAAGEEFSEERLLHVVARHAGDGLESLLDEVRREVTRFTGRSALEDDCTLLALRRPRGPGLA